MTYIVFLFSATLVASLILKQPILYTVLIFVGFQFTFIIYLMYFNRDIKLRPGKQYWLNLQDKKFFGRN